MSAQRRRLAAFGEDAVIWCVDFIQVKHFLPPPLKEILQEEGANVFTAEMLGRVAANLKEFDCLAPEPFVAFFEPPSLDERIVNQFALFSLMSSPTASLAHWLEGQIPAIIRNTPPDEVIRTDLYDIPPIKQWWQGRVALLGDAAHAMTPNLGQGGAQAIEDAYVLAEKVAAHAQPEAAFAEYQRLRKPKADWVARTAGRLGWAAHFRSLPARWSRDTMLRLTPGWVNDGLIDRLLRLDY